MNCCCDKRGAQMDREMIDSLSKIPVLRFLKEPVENTSELYVRYPNGGEYGWYVWVNRERTFYYWDADTVEWEAMHKTMLVELGIEAELMKDGDILVWDEKREKFVAINMTLIGENEY